MSIPCKAIYRFNTIHMKTRMPFFTELEQKNLKHVWKYKRPWETKPNTGKKNGAGGIRFPDFILYYKVTLIKVVLAQSIVLSHRQKYRSKEQDGKNRSKLTHAKSCLTLFVTLWTVASKVPLSMGSSRQEYWIGLLCPPPQDLPNPGTEPTSLRSPALMGRFFTTSITWETQNSKHLWSTDVWRNRQEYTKEKI